jgi:hypothetical protein
MPMNFDGNYISDEFLNGLEGQAPTALSFTRLR